VSRDLSTHIKREVVMNGVMNVICNGGITWLLLKGGKPLVLVGIPSIGVDLAATGAIMLFIIALIFIPLNHRKMVKGDLESLRWQAGNRLHGLLQRFPPITVAAWSVFRAGGSVDFYTGDRCAAFLSGYRTVGAAELFGF
jgi:hypothetical protein